MAEEPKTSLPLNVIGEGRPAALLVHGFLDGGRIWTNVAQQLNAAGITVATVDLPGMGGTNAEPEAISLDAYAEAVAAAVDEIGAGLVLVGQSMGAQVVELTARLRPDAIKGMVLLTPVPLAGVGAPDEVVAPFRSAGGQAEVQREQRRSLSHHLTGDPLEALVTLGLEVRPDVVARLVDVWNGGHRAGHAPSGFAGPVVVVRGESDPFVTQETAKTVADRFERGAMHTVDKAGHWAHVEQPAEVARYIKDLIEGLGLAGSASAADWRSAFSRKSATAFGQAFAEDVEIEAVTLIKPVRGRENVQRVMEAASKVYSSLTFTDQASAGNKQYVEWVAEAHEGVAFNGVTILTRNETGSIAHIAIHHRPMKAAIFFSKRMGNALNDVLGPGYFLENDGTKGEAE